MHLRTRRKWINVIALGLSLAAMAFGLFWLIWILWMVLEQGIGALSLSLFTLDTPAPGNAGGLRNAIVGSFMLVGLAMLMATPVAILTGVYLAEYGRRGWLGSATRFVNDILLSAPSIVVGLFVYAIYVAHMGKFSGFSGALALALLVVPVVVPPTIACTSSSSTRRVAKVRARLASPPSS